MSVSVKAPAKINLYLHVTGKRPDGYHLLDSLFAFARDGDVITAKQADGLSLEIIGAPDLSAGEDNIVIKAARKLAAALGIEPNAHLVLEKNLPIASGIGGGSTDAAAALKALQVLWKKTLPDEKLYDLALELGADVPSCLACKAVQVSGVGEVLTPTPEIPALPVVLVNPNKPVSTPAVFKTRKPVFSEPMPLTQNCADAAEFIGELKKRHNDLQDAACALEPAVAEVLHVLENQPLCLFSAMSGSGGTCFGLFRTPENAANAAEDIAATHPNWWVKQTALA